MKKNDRLLKRKGLFNTGNEKEYIETWYNTEYISYSKISMLLYTYDYYDNRLIIYLGLSNESIISNIIYRQRSL